MKNSKYRWITSIVLVVWLMTGSTILLAQTDVKKDIQEALREVEDELNQLSGVQVDFGGKYKNGSPKLGIYIEDLDFEEVYERHYPYNYGVLVTGVNSGGYSDRAGIIRNDIIMEFDGEKVRFVEHLLNLRDGKAYGDSARVKIFRNEKEFTTTIYFTPPSPDTDEFGAPLSLKEKNKLGKKKRLSVGYGGGGPVINVIHLNHSNLNSFLKINGLDPIGTNEMALVGGFGMGNVGNGWFIGGMGSKYLNTQKKAIRDTSGILTGEFKTAKIDMSYGGVTITKKYALFTRNIVFDFSTLIGGGAMKVAVGHTDGNYSWDNQVEDMNSNLVTYQKEFFVVQPSIGLMYRIFDWAAIHGSVGYLGMYSSDDKWTDTEFDFTVTGNSPSLKDALSYNLGIWFGF